MTERPGDGGGTARRVRRRPGPRRYVAGAESRLRRFRWSPLGRTLKASLDQLRLVRVARSLRLLHGPQRPILGRLDWIVLCLVRNGEDHLPSFLDHHRRQGARHFVFVDNGSTDGTVDRLRHAPATTVFETRLPYGRFQWLIRRHLVTRFALQRWSLSLDIDERFDYPFSEVVSMPSLLRYLENRGATALVAYLLDRFPPGPLLEHLPGPGDDPERRQPLYDVSEVRREPYDSVRRSRGSRLSNPEIRWLRGGVRQSAFGVDESLTKQPLVFNGRGTRPRPGHHVLGARVADFTAVLHHFKFTRSFLPTLHRALDEGSFSRNSESWRRMQRALEADPRLRLDTGEVRTLRTVDQLVEEGFLVVSDEFRRWASAVAERAAAGELRVTGTVAGGARGPVLSSGGSGRGPDRRVRGGPGR
jgi:hypothetical protein